MLQNHSKCLRKSTVLNDATRELKSRPGAVAAEAFAVDNSFVVEKPILSTVAVDSLVDRVMLQPSNSLNPSESPVECLTYKGIPYEHLLDGQGYRCRACKRPKYTLNKDSVIRHIRQVHLKVVTTWKPNLWVYEDKKRQRIRYLDKYFCHKLPDGRFKCETCGFTSKGKKIPPLLMHIRMRHTGELKIQSLLTPKRSCI